MHWSTMEVSRYEPRWIGQVALYVPLLCVIMLLDLGLHYYGLSHIGSCAASYCWSLVCFRFHVLFSNVHPGSYFWWIQLQRRGELTGVCVADMFYRVAHFLKSLLFGSIRLQSHLVEVFLESWLAVVEWWGRWWRKEVGNPEDYLVSYKSNWNEWQPTCTFNSSRIRLHIAALRQAEGDSNGPAMCNQSVGCCLFVCRDISWWTIADSTFLIDQKGHSLTERTSGDVCLKTSLGSYLNHTLTIKSQYTVSMTIPTEVTLKTLILLCSNWWNLPTLTQKTQLASMWSISCNIQHLAQQQGQHKIQWSMLRKRTFHHIRWANMANQRRNPHDDVTKWIQARVAWRQKGSQRWEHCAAYDLKEGFGGETTGITLFKQRRQWEIDQGLCG